MKTVFLWSRKSWTELCWISSGLLGEFARLRLMMGPPNRTKMCVIFLVLDFFCVFEFQFCMFQLNFCDMQYQVVAIKYDRFSMVFAHTHYSFLFLFFCTGMNFLFPTFFCLRIQIMQECLRHFSNCLIMLHKTVLGIFFLRRFFCMRTNWTFRA